MGKYNTQETKREYMSLYHHVENCVSVYKHNKKFYELLDKSFIDEMRLGQG